MTEPDAIMLRLGEGIGLSQRGERAAAREVFAALWAETADPLHRCGIAHAMADVQDDVHDELTWDLLALAAADQVADERASAAGLQGSASLYPSLHLNLAECYRKLGDPDLARQHVALGQQTVTALGQDGYADMIRSALTRVAEQLS